jgi:hypothetical protein
MTSAVAASAAAGVPIFPISLLQDDDLELLALHQTIPEGWLFLGDVMAAALPHLAEAGLVPAGSASATSVIKSLTDGCCVALELRLREQSAAPDDKNAFSMVFRVGIYLGLEDHRYWSHMLLMWACRPDEAEESWPPTEVHHGALRLAGKLQPRQFLAGRECLVGANTELREEMTRYGSTLEGLSSEFCYRMTESITP